MIKNGVVGFKRVIVKCGTAFALSWDGRVKCEMPAGSHMVVVPDGEVYMYTDRPVDISGLHVDLVSTLDLDVLRGSVSLHQYITVGSTDTAQDLYESILDMLQVQQVDIDNYYALVEPLKYNQLFIPINGYIELRDTTNTYQYGRVLGVAYRPRSFGGGSINLFFETNGKFVDVWVKSDSMTKVISYFGQNLSNVSMNCWGFQRLPNKVYFSNNQEYYKEG